MSKKVFIGNVAVGGGERIKIQSMSTFKISNIEKAVNECLTLKEEGLDIMRFSVLDDEDARAFKIVKERSGVPLVADIHFDYKLALKAIEGGADKIRINPGNIGSEKNIKAVADALRSAKIPVRVGANTGSIEKEFLSKYGKKIIDVLLQTGYHVVVRPHPQSFTSEKVLMESLMKEYPNSEQLEWNRDADNFEVLKRSDILISDFSGVIFDFALVYDKPVIYADTKFDDSIYDAWWLDSKLWTFEILPYLGMQLNSENMHSLKEMIDKCISEEKYAEGRKKAIADTWAYQGEGAKRVADFIIAKHKEICDAETIKGEDE